MVILIPPIIKKKFKITVFFKEKITLKINNNKKKPIIRCKGEKHRIDQKKNIYINIRHVCLRFKENMS